MISNLKDLTPDFRHFHRSSGRLIATIATVTWKDKIAVGIARCNKKDRPSKRKGREIATERLMNGLLGLSKHEQEKNLFTVVTLAEFQKILQENPFNAWGCKFGASTEELKKLQKKPSRRTNAKQKRV